MNKVMGDILLYLYENQYINQRKLAEELDVSLGLINKNIKALTQEKYLNQDIKLTQKATSQILQSSPQNAIILAAGYGVRMVPINTEISKGLLEVKGEILIERLIKQLHEVGIQDIKIVVGFMKEKYEYLIDKYHVELIINQDYKEKNNLYSLKLAENSIHNTYIIPCNIYCKTNPFKKNELYSWYMVSKKQNEKSAIRVNKKMEFSKSIANELGNKMIGIAYISNNDQKQFQNSIKRKIEKRIYDNSPWEEVFTHEKEIFFKPNFEKVDDITIINTYEELRDFDKNSNNLNHDAIEIIKEVFHVTNDEIKEITVLKKGMTNRSFTFVCNNEKYIMRIPGTGTDKLINRSNEAAVYGTIKDLKICDEIYYINPKNGYKITKFINNARTCNPQSESDLKKCMKKLKELHDCNLKVHHEFDLWKQIDFYESLWNGLSSVYQDYDVTKKNVLELKEFIDKNSFQKCLTHIDAIPDNFLISENDIRLIDWEYASMQDPHVDIAMFCIYSLYKKEEIDHLIDIYFENKCEINIRIKIYAYIAVCGLLWSNWCEFKRNLGVEFGEYSIRQYRYAKEYYKIAKEEIERLKTNE